jgi:hypothetical protein
MAVQQLHDGGADGVNIGQATTSLVSFHGVTAVDQAATIALATNATIATVRTAVRAIITALEEKGLIAGGP